MRMGVITTLIGYLFVPVHSPNPKVFCSLESDVRRIHTALKDLSRQPFPTSNQKIRAPKSRNAAFQ